jgi:hypothetical protein
MRESIDPKMTELAMEINFLDDWITEGTRRMVEQERNAGPSETERA